MSRKQTSHVAMTALLCLLSIVPASQAKHSQATHSKPGDFEFYLLTLSFAPSFCSLTPANRSKDECQQLTEAKFEQTPLTIHGLWPNRARVSVNKQPSSCAHVPLQLSNPVQTDLARYMPGGTDLEQHEWDKHGTCSGLSPDEYFSTAVSLAKHMNDVVAGVMRDKAMLGSQLNVRQLIDGVADKDQALAASMVVSCAQPRASGGQKPGAVVEEIRFTLSKEFKPIAASSVGMGQNSGCPGGAGRVPSVQ
jgi:ribonuclease T2